MLPEGSHPKQKCPAVNKTNKIDDFMVDNLTFNFLPLSVSTATSTAEIPEIRKENTA